MRAEKALVSIDDSRKRFCIFLSFSLISRASANPYSRALAKTNEIAYANTKNNRPKNSCYKKRKEEKN